MHERQAKDTFSSENVRPIGWEYSDGTESSLFWFGCRGSAPGGPVQPDQLDGTEGELGEEGVRWGGTVDWLRESLLP